jgi:hypothetical protein
LKPNKQGVAESRRAPLLKLEDNLELLLVVARRLLLLLGQRREAQPVPVKYPSQEPRTGKDATVR